MFKMMELGLKELLKNLKDKVISWITTSNPSRMKIKDSLYYLTEVKNSTPVWIRILISTIINI